MQRPPQVADGLVFDERFFDSVFKRAGGHRLLDLHTPPQGSKHVDYLISGFVLELKILMADPLDAVERQAKLSKFFAEEFPKGPLFVTATKREAKIAGDLQKKFWERYLGAPVQDRLNSAADQITATRTFVLEPLRGAVLIVNSAGTSLDWQSFSHLANHFGSRFDAIDAVFAMNAVPVTLDKGFQLHFATIGKQGHRDEADALGIRLDVQSRLRLSNALENDVRKKKSILTPNLRRSLFNSRHADFEGNKTRARILNRARGI